MFSRIFRFFYLGGVVCMLFACNNDLSSHTARKSEQKVDRSQRIVIDSAQYVDFTIPENNAKTVRNEDIIHALNNTIYKNENSTITIKAKERTIEITSDSGFYNDKNNCQIYGVFSFDIQAASEDCLYIRRDQNKTGFLIIDDSIFRDEAIPDLAACLPLYGYSRNRIEVSSIMDGYIVMPSGTYWKNK